MPTMKNADLERYRRMLGELTSRVSGDAAAVAEQTRGASGGQGVGELSNAPMHLGDMGTEEFLHGMNAALLENEEYLSREVSAALGRIEKGTYGVCESCGKTIRKERLEAVPYARFCVRCAEEHDDAPRANYNAGRPRSPSDVLAPEVGVKESKLARQARRSEVEDAEDDRIEAGERHALGTAGGGTAIGGLAGVNIGSGDPDVGEVEEATASDDREDEVAPPPTRSIRRASPPRKPR